MIQSRYTVVLSTVIAFGYAGWGAACTTEGAGGTFQDGGSPVGPTAATGPGTSPVFGGASAGDASATGPCVGLQCQQVACASGASTSISGTVYDPAGKNPLYNVVVYVPNAPVQPLAQGATCDTCNSLYSGSPVATALTDASGKFTLTNAPAGQNIPLVIQVGKWRKQLTIATVAQCQDNPQADKTLTLPRNHTEGDIPNIAISTGGSDSLECLFRRVGLDAAEYGPGAAGAGHIHIFQGASNGAGGNGGGGNGGGAPTTSTPAPASTSGLWDSTADLAKYDIVLLSCEGAETTGMNQQALFDYAAAGGRVFASHFHYSWFNTGPFGSANLATWTTGTSDMGSISANITTALPSGQPFPKGVALKSWLTNVSALTGGELPITDARHNADVSATNTASQAWITADQNATPAGATEYFTFNTPLAAAPDKQCGRVVFSDLHVGAASKDYAAGAKTVPDGCSAGDLSPQEKALEFMLFDLSSCVTPDTQPPVPPTPAPR